LDGGEIEPETGDMNAPLLQSAPDLDVFDLTQLFKGIAPALKRDVWDGPVPDDVRDVPDWLRLSHRGKCEPSRLLHRQICSFEVHREARGRRTNAEHPRKQEARGSDLEPVEGHGDPVFFAFDNHSCIDPAQHGRLMSVPNQRETPVLDREDQSGCIARHGCQRCRDLLHRRKPAFPVGDMECKSGVPDLEFGDLHLAPEKRDDFGKDLQACDRGLQSSRQGDSRLIHDQPRNGKERKVDASECEGSGNLL